MHVIGKGDSPVYICKKKEIPGLFTNEFYRLYEMWYMFHQGFGLPSPKHWTEQDPDLMKMLSNMKAHFDRYFSHDATMRQYKEAELKRGR